MVKEPENTKIQQLLEVYSLADHEVEQVEDNDEESFNKKMVLNKYGEYEYQSSEEEEIYD